MSLMPRDEIIMVAYLIADGCTTRSTPTFVNETPEIIDEFIEIANRLSRKTGVTEYKCPGKARNFSVTGLTWLLEKYNLKGKTSRNKRIPDRVYGLNDKDLGLFINRFWACDGWIETVGPATTLANELLIQDFVRLLKRFNVYTNYRPKPSTCNGKVFDAWRIKMHSRVKAEAFLKATGPILGKEEACYRCLGVYFFKKSRKK